MKNKITVRFIPFKGTTSILYKGKEPKTKEEFYDFVMGDSLLQCYFPQWLRDDLDSTESEQEILKHYNDPEEGIMYKTLKEYILDEFFLDNYTFKDVIETIDSNLRNYDNRLEVE